VLLNNGVDIIVVSRRLGHSKPSITLDVYGHLIKGSDDKAALVTGDLLALK
jgi:integrase